jgi:hypothetical protein
MADSSHSKREQILQLWAIYLGESQMESEGDVKTLEDLLQQNPAREEKDKWLPTSNKYFYLI